MRIVVTLVDERREQSICSDYFNPGEATLTDLQASVAEIIARLWAETQGAGSKATAWNDRVRCLDKTVLFQERVIAELVPVVQMFVRERCDNEPIEKQRLEDQWNKMAPPFRAYAEWVAKKKWAAS